MKPVRALRLAALAIALFMLLVPWAQAQKMRGTAVSEERIALVIGNAAYRDAPLDNPVNDAQLIAASLRRAGFSVTLRENLGRTALLDAMREFGSRMNEQTVAVLYYAGHGLQLRDHNYLIPVDADIHSEDEIPIAGIDLGFILGRMSYAHSRVNIVILDACRNNPFAGKTIAASQGLAQMDAPVGTLLAFATAPGKLAADSGGGANSLYATYLAKQMLSPGLPVESVFKRVREGVVRDTKEQQVPWEHSSLKGEFAFVPGVEPAAQQALSSEQQAAGEMAFWNSVQSSRRPDEYQAYLRQYPDGRFAALAQSRIAAFAASSPAQAPAAAPTTSAARPELLPHPGDSWRYRVQDQFRLGDLFMTARVESVGAEGVTETWTTTSDAKVRSVVAPLEAGFHALPSWTLAPPEFAPYLLALGPLRRGAHLPEQQRRIDQVTVPLSVSVEGEEEITVQAGRFHTVKLVLRGQVQPRGAGRAGAVSTEQTVWYASEVKRVVKSTVSTRVGTSQYEATSFELTELKLN